MLLASSTNHGWISEFSLRCSCVLLTMWHLIVLMMPRIGITVFSMTPVDGLSLCTVSSIWAEDHCGADTTLLQ